MDLATVEGLQAYLDNTPFASSSITPLTGGFGNYVFRIQLREPYDGRASLVLKHAKPYLPGLASLAFPLERQKFEVEALRRVKGLLPQGSLVTVPTVHLFDEDKSVIIMDDCGEDVMTLKELTLNNTPSVDLAQMIGNALGIFLGQLHSWVKGNPEVVQFFAENKTMAQLSAFVTYGRLISTLTGADALPALADPALEVPKEQMNIIQKIAEEKTKEVTSTCEAFVMGDFWPGNILVSLSFNGSMTTLKRMYVVDWEMAKAGIPGMDVGQFCAEMHLLRRFNPSCESSVSAVLSAFMKAYRETRRGDIQGVARAALVHLGAHLVTWTPRVPWGSKETTREVVSEGIGYLVNGYREIDSVVASSLVGRLLAVDKY